MNKKIPCLALAALSLAGLLAGCDDSQTELKRPVYNTTINPKETKASAFKETFPQQYASYMRNDESEVMTKYKGSINFQKHNNSDPLPKGFKYTQPYLKNLWLGYPFMYEYNEARGHTYAVEDFLDIDRINRYAVKGSMPATCWNCKTPKMMEWVEEYGNDFWTKDVNEFRDKIAVRDEMINCANCHDPKTMELRLYSEPLKDWLVRSGQDISKLSRNDMRALVCAQCHVEYYFTHKDNGPAGRPVFPWDNGFTPADMYEYYKTQGPKDASGKPGPFADWTHAASKVPMLKAQHPEYSTWIDGPHGAAGVTCADCHMPYQKVDGKKVSSHWWTSPLKDPELAACRQCHADKTAEYLKERVHYTQDKTYVQLINAQDASVRAHEAVRLANAWTGEKSPRYEELMAQSRELVRKGQFFWDYVSAENSIGFHNPAKTLDTLMSSQEYSREAVDLACEATNFGISQALAGDIHEIVPPIKEFSRKDQQDESKLQAHPWLKLLPVLPKAEQVWDGEKKLVSTK